VEAEEKKTFEFDFKGISPGLALAVLTTLPPSFDLPESEYADKVPDMDDAHLVKKCVELEQTVDLDFSWAKEVLEVVETSGNRKCFLWKDADEAQLQDLIAKFAKLE